MENYVSKSDWLLDRTFTVVIAGSVLVSLIVVLIHLIVSTRLVPKGWSAVKECFRSHDYQLVSQEDYEAAQNAQQVAGNTGADDPPATGETSVSYTSDYIRRMGGSLALSNYFLRTAICAVEIILTVIVFAPRGSEKRRQALDFDILRKKKKQKNSKSEWETEDWLDITLLVYWTWILILTLSLFKLRRKLRGIVARHLIILSLIFALAFAKTAIWPTAALDIRSPTLSTIDWTRGLLGIIVAGLALMDWNVAIGRNPMEEGRHGDGEGRES